MADAILTPFDFSDTVKAGRRRFWKQILPVTSIDYDGQKIDFDEDFHKDLALSHREGAYDQVPLVFADGENRHNMDPRNFGGEVLDIQYRGAAKGQGTWALIEADRDTDKILRKNPRLGVSARILQNINKADGRTFKRAVNHVLLTMNPRVSGMEPWQAVNLSDEGTDIEVVDLTAETYEEGTPMGKPVTKTKSTTSGKIDLSNLSDEQFETLLDLAATALAEDEDIEDEEDEEALDDDVEDTTTTPPVRKKKSKTKITVEKESEDDGDDEEEEEDDEEVDLSDAEKVRRNSDHATVRGMQIDLAEEKWKGQRKDYVLAGVPPFLLDLAEPVLKQPEAMTIDLSDSESIDASATIRKMLDGVKGLIDLTPEIGHMVDLSEQNKNDSDDVFLKAWDEQYG